MPKSENIFPIQPIWALRNVFYTILGMPLPLLFIWFAFGTSVNGKDWGKPVGYLLMFIVFTVVSLPLNFIYTILRMLTFHYLLEESNFIIKEGVIYKQNRTIPYSSIQTVSVHQGLFERIAHLATLQIENASDGGGQYLQLNYKQQRSIEGTIGSYGNIVTLPGLHQDDAQKLKEMLLNKIKNTSTVELGI